MGEIGSVAERRLNAARIVGASTIAFIGQLAIDMPGGYLGGADEITTAAWGYAAILLLLTALGAIGQLRAKGWSTIIIPLALSLNIGFFVSALAAGPLIAGLVMAWNITALLWFVFPLRLHSTTGSRTFKKRHQEDVFADLRPAVRHLLLVSLLISIAVVGYELSELFVVQVVTLVLDIFAIILTAPLVLYWLRTKRYRIIGLLLPLVMSVFFLGYPTIFLSLLVFYQVIVLAILLTQGPLMDDLLEYFYEYPALLVLATFALLSIVGTLFLSFPAASATGNSISPLDAFFTATSAACITGLIVLDTPADFSTFGHVVILVLIQLGGMGILVLSTFATLILGSRLGLRAENALEEVLDLRGSRNAYELTIFIVVATLMIEFVGGILLSIRFWAHDYAFGSALWHGFFHAISAFCHAGFALQSDSLVMFQQDPIAITVFCVLITLGGIGFFVLAAGWFWLKGKQRRIMFPVKVVLLATAVLIVTGLLLFLVGEWNASLAHLGPLDKVMNALFQSITLRSAGLNTVDTSAFQPSTILFMIFFMFVGGSPGSTAGGIKITTLVILIAAVRAISRGEPRVVLFKRYIPQTLVYRAAGIAFISLTILLILCFLLLLTQPLPFEILVFEAASALGTVGLSLGATPELNSIGKLLVIAVIFMGRVGPLALALVLGQGKSSRINYPEGKIMVG